MKKQKNQIMFILKKMQKRLKKRCKVIIYKTLNSSLLAKIQKHLVKKFSSQGIFFINALSDNCILSLPVAYLDNKQKH